ncbi:hypothetical protein [Clostridium sp.]|uniref:hypothetical protein n=1 Tax=Clostridium sp. TaxID=1506 RepID=UPI0032162CAA
MRKLKKTLVGILLVASAMAISACGLGSNEDFDYMKQRSIMKVTIQSTRDKSYKFTVTDEDVIEDIYEILSGGTVVEEKSTLDSDYILEIYESPTEVKTFNYVAGLDKSDGGNFYNDDSKYIISKRLDNDIIKNFANIRKPIDFRYIYYTSIMSCIEYYNNTEGSNPNIGINIMGDIMASRFQISTEIEDFKQKLNKSGNVVLMDTTMNDEDFDVVMNIKTQGYTSKKYKAIITIKSNDGQAPIEYYVSDVYDQGEWKVTINEDMPEGF